MSIYKPIVSMYATIAINEETNTLLSDIQQHIKEKNNEKKALSKGKIILEGLKLLKEKEGLI